MAYRRLLSPIQVGPLVLPNRVVMSPLTTNYAEAGTGRVTDQLVEYYRARAKGGVGLVIVEGAIVREDGRGFPRQILADRDELIPGLARLAAAIKESGSRVILQLLHHGRQTRSASAGAQPVAPSALPCPVFKETPRELSLTDIRELQRCFVDAALRAQAAGFDGVELHAAHGYLIGSFLSPWSNRRTDAYGGETVNRLRFLLEIIDEIKRRAGESFAILCRLSANEYVEGGLDTDEVIRMGNLLHQAGVHGLDISAGVAASFIKMSPPTGTPEAPYADVVARIKRNVGLPVIAVARILTPQTAEELIREGKTDLVALGRALVADPEWVNKARAGVEGEIIPCIGCNVCNGRSHQPEVVCALNPFTGREHRWQIEPAGQPKRVAILGNGIGGYQAALILRRRGHEVTVFSQRQLPFAGLIGLRSQVPLQAELAKVAAYFEGQFRRWNIERKDRGEFVPEDYDCVINTMVDPNGRPLLAEPWHQAWKTKAEQAKWQELQALDILNGRTPEHRQIYVLGGSLLGCEAALLLARDYRVVIVEEKNRIPYDVGNTILRMIQATLQEQGVTVAKPDIAADLTEPAAVVWATGYPQLLSVSSGGEPLEGGQNQRTVFEWGDAYPPDALAVLMAQAAEFSLHV